MHNDVQLFCHRFQFKLDKGFLDLPSTANRAPSGLWSIGWGIALWSSCNCLCFLPFCVKRASHQAPKRHALSFSMLDADTSDTEGACNLTCFKHERLHGLRTSRKRCHERHSVDHLVHLLAPGWLFSVVDRTDITESLM